jgi:class 3 adenylate cyclase
MPKKVSQAQSQRHWFRAIYHRVVQMSNGEMPKHIDELVTTRIQKQAELVAISQKIASSATPIVVGFADLAASTQMKQDREPEEWLEYVFEFIRCIDRQARNAGGTVVKRIGDELMVTFNDVQASERFIDSLITDTAIQTYRYKIAVDFGRAYHFRFEDRFEDDPYGPVVDRCARMAQYASAGTVMCSREYRHQLGTLADYSSLGSFALRGFRNVEELFARSLVRVDSEAYLTPIVKVVNQEGRRAEGYRFVGRKLTMEFVREFGKGEVRPFLARELLNVPKLPYSPRDFAEIIHRASNRWEKGT